MKKVLFVATVENHLNAFHIPYLKWFREQGWEVHTACNGDELSLPADKRFNIPFARSPFKQDNITAYNELKRIINEEAYDVIHCHTPVGGVLTRLAARMARKKGTRVIYTAHGFHFYNGAPLINWLLYYPIEKWLAGYTDVLITINKEDYDLAKKSFKAKQVEYVNGVGVNLNKFKPQIIEDKIQLRKAYGYNEDDFILIYAGELNHNKNQGLLISIIALLKEKIPSIKLLLAGTGELLEQYKGQANTLGVTNYIEFLGFRNDIPSLMLLSDIAVSSSRREGLPVNVMEAMATGLPLVVTNCRGNRDLVLDGVNGYIIELSGAKAFANAILRLYNSEELRNTFAQKSLELVGEYSIEMVTGEMERIYVS